MHYNPFEYIRSEKDILKFVNALIANTKGEGSQGGEDFWVKAERLYYSALIGYIWYEAADDEKNMITLIDMINMSEAKEDDEDFKNPVDELFEELEQKNPDHFAVRQYILTDEKSSREYILQMWAEATEIYRAGKFTLAFSPEMSVSLKERQQEFMPEDTKVGIIQTYLDGYKGDIICSKQIYKDALNHSFEEPKQWEVREINDIMNQSIDGWERFSYPRVFAEYGRQKGWERKKPNKVQPTFNDTVSEKTDECNEQLMLS